MSVDKVEILQNKLTDIAKDDPKRKFHSLRDKVYRMVDMLTAMARDMLPHPRESAPPPPQEHNIFIWV